jgi:hypothetical protein
MRDVSLPPSERQVRDPGIARPDAARRDLATRVVMLAIVLSVSIPATSAEPVQSGAFFAEPISGRRVTEYEVKLPTGRSETRTFAIPQDCAEVIRCVDEGAVHRATILDRSLWHKVDNDCRFYSFLYRHPQQVVEDFVSDYDFRNADLSDLPIDVRCAQGEEGCDPATTDPLGMLRYFPLGMPSHGLDNNHELGSCRLIDGVFRGQLFIDQEGIHCDAGAGGPTLRLIAVDYADINGDQYLDAVLRFVPIGPGAARVPLILPLTRTEPGGPFHVPEPAPGTVLPPIAR